MRSTGIGRIGSRVGKSMWKQEEVSAGRECGSR